MQTYQPTVQATYERTQKTSSTISNFLQWCTAQEHNRYGWLALIVALHGCVLAPVTAMFVITAGNSIVLWGITALSMTACLFTNLAAMPTKITIPVFAVSVIVNLAVIALCLHQIIIR